MKKKIQELKIPVLSLLKYFSGVTSDKSSNAWQLNPFLHFFS